MKTLFSLFLIAFCATTTVNAQDFSDLDKSPMAVTIIRNQDNSPMARIIYSRPMKKDRKIFGKLVPFGEVWRTGANEATEITLYNDMQVGGQTIHEGTYTLYTIPEKNEWTIILNKDTKVWGAYTYDKSQDAVRIKAPARKAAAPIENFSMAFQPTSTGTNLFIGWDDTYVKVPFKKTEMKKSNKMEKSKKMKNSGRMMEQNKTDDTKEMDEN